MLGRSNTLPLPVERLTDGQYIIRWNIKRNDQPTTQGGAVMEGYDFEYNTKYQAKEVTKKEIMIAVIREKYDSTDEISLTLKRTGDEAKLQAHEDYVLFARATADQIISDETI